VSKIFPGTASTFMPNLVEIGATMWNCYMHTNRCTVPLYRYYGFKFSVSSSDYIALDDTMTNGEGGSNGLLWGTVLNFCVQWQMINMKNFGQDCQSSGQDLNPGHSNMKLQLFTNHPVIRSYVVWSTNNVIFNL
jgi:hypothetical protein